MLLDSLAVVVGLILLVWSADKFVLGAASIAAILNISPLVIGIVVVGFGTSAPEMLISAFSAWQGNPGLAIGNAFGSNIANIALILGVTALVRPIVIHNGIVRRELPVLIGITLFVLFLILDESLSLTDGLMLIAGLLLVMGWMTRLALKAKASTIADYSTEVPAIDSTGVAVLWLITGLALLLISSKLLVWGAVNIATDLGISDLIIGLTIVAIGTSLPEMAASIAGVIKGQQDIVVGNIIGSNLFNTLGVVGIPAIINPFILPDGVLTRDFPVMFGFTVILLIMANGIRGGGGISRIAGSLLLLGFTAYQALLYSSAIS